MTGASQPLVRLVAGQSVIVGGDRVVEVDETLASAFAPGDRLAVADESVIHLRADDLGSADRAVTDAVEAFGRLTDCSDTSITSFFERAAALLADESVVADLTAINEADVASALERGRSVTRLRLDARMIEDMAAGLRMWADAPPERDGLLETVEHDSWRIQTRRAPLGVVGFVFEGRPNVVVDAAGVIRSGNTAVLRIGSDALATARAIIERVLRPALAECGLPIGAVGLVDAESHGAGYALFSDRRLSLAVARGSGAAVASLGSVARSAGVPVSLHGTGGAWMLVAGDASADRLAAVVERSLDRKVCNTLNVCCIPASRADELVPVVAGALAVAAEGRPGATAHLTDAARSRWPESLAADVEVEHIEVEELGREWEWEDRPEVTVHVVDDLDAAVRLCNHHSPRFVVSVITDDPATVESVYGAVDAPFVGDGFTRWVDGQYALRAPELGLSNWEHGRLLGRSAILSGSSVHTVRHLARFEDPGIQR
ncbi:MAG: aldehyde dehydrogenase family protein [Actinomycetota bacterium]|jgi:glutamate-5-semialdehyde dehydrogenase|nr:aldehyde dehydrogenase family protein [Actinomycetota bacterium]MDA2973777.1 aldehyde dehydrogenase family protein [Actinomycetota bacterium]MDA3010702.1 aldehyde dehydrogenase family protein [Actinomycetota bacterium]